MKCPNCGRDAKRLNNSPKFADPVCMRCVLSAKKKSAPAAKPAKTVDSGKSALSITFTVRIDPGTTALELMDIIRALPSTAVVA